MERQPAASQNDRPATPGIWRSPGGLCILKADRSHTREVVPGALFMKHMFSRDFSIVTSRPIIWPSMKQLRF